MVLGVAHGHNHFHGIIIDHIQHAADNPPLGLKSAGASFHALIQLILSCKALIYPLHQQCTGAMPVAMADFMLVFNNCQLQTMMAPSPCTQWYKPYLSQRMPCTSPSIAIPDCLTLKFWVTSLWHHSTSQLPPTPLSWRVSIDKTCKQVYCNNNVTQYTVTASSNITDYWC